MFFVGVVLLDYPFKGIVQQDLGRVKVGLK
jgi:hypothetical protein